MEDRFKFKVLNTETNKLYSDIEDLSKESKSDSHFFLSFQWAVESPGSHAVDYEDKKFFESCKIIGNIYENLELLNKHQ